MQAGLDKSPNFPEYIGETDNQPCHQTYPKVHLKLATHAHIQKFERHLIKAKDIAAEVTRQPTKERIGREIRLFRPKDNLIKNDCLTQECKDRKYHDHNRGSHQMPTELTKVLHKAHTVLVVVLIHKFFEVKNPKNNL